MNLIALDFETYYDKDYSLKKLTTEEYVRSPLFEAILLCARVNGRNFVARGADIRNLINALDLGNNAVVAHNCRFDAFILSHHYGTHPKVLFDTMGMGRGLYGAATGVSLAALAEFLGVGVKKSFVLQEFIGRRGASLTEQEWLLYEDYCTTDVALCEDIFNQMLPLFPRDELRTIDNVLKMYTRPLLRLNSDKLQAMILRDEERLREVLAVVGVTQAEIASNPQFVKCLEYLGVEAPMKISPSTGVVVPALAKADAAFLDLLDHPDDAVVALVEARLAVKSRIVATRAKRLHGIASRGLFPVPLKYAAAVTHRLAGDEKINAQNIPARGPAAALKDAIEAPEGYTIIDPDSSQIEARTLAWWAGQDDLTEAFRKGEDVYKKQASRIFQRPEADITKSERFIGKQTILGCGFGMGKDKFYKATTIAARLQGIELGQFALVSAELAVSGYRSTNKKIAATWKQGNAVLDAMLTNHGAPFGKQGVVLVCPGQCIMLPNGLYLNYANLRKEADNAYIYDRRMGSKLIPTYITGPKLVENVIQALAGLIVKFQMNLIAERYPVVLQVHDSNPYLALDAEVDEAVEYGRKCMSTVPPWAEGLPITCEIKHGKTYGQC